MVKIVRNSSPFILAVCALLMIQLIGCSEDDADEDVDLEGNVNPDSISVSGAPPLPPDESMTVDLSLFDEEVDGGIRAPAVATHLNFGNAAVRVASINAALAAAVAPPATLFAAARLYEPTPQSDGSWVWNYSVTIEYVTFTASLTCMMEGDETRWSMVVSANAPLRPVVSFLWYQGVCTEMNTSGTWEFFDIATPTEQNPTATVEWTADVDNKTAHLLLKNVDTRPDAENTGDILSYDVGSEIASIIYTDASESEVWSITWDTETGEGSLRVPEYNGGEKACWNDLKQDVTCP